MQEIQCAIFVLQFAIFVLLQCAIFVSSMLYIRYIFVYVPVYTIY